MSICQNEALLSVPQFKHKERKRGGEKEKERYDLFERRENTTVEREWREKELIKSKN